MTAFPASLLVSAERLEVRSGPLSPAVIARHQTKDVAFRRRLLGRVLEVHPLDYDVAPLIVFRPLDQGALEAELRDRGWLA